MLLADLLDVFKTDVEVNLWNEEQEQIGIFEASEIEDKFLNCEVIFANPYDMGELYVEIYTVYC